MGSSGKDKQFSHEISHNSQPMSVYCLNLLHPLMGVPSAGVISMNQCLYDDVRLTLTLSLNPVCNVILQMYNYVVTKKMLAWWVNKQALKTDRSSKTLSKNMILYSSSRINRCKNDIKCADTMHTQFWRILYSICYGFFIFLLLAGVIKTTRGFKIVSLWHLVVFMSSWSWSKQRLKCLHSTVCVRLKERTTPLFLFCNEVRPPPPNKLQNMLFITLGMEPALVQMFWSVGNARILTTPKNGKICSGLLIVLTILITNNCSGI